MKLVEKLNAISNCSQYIKLDDLEVDRPYLIIDAEKVYSEKLKKRFVCCKIEYDDNVYYKINLPSKFSCLSDDDVKSLTGIEMIYKGMSKNKDYNSHVVEFEN